MALICDAAYFHDEPVKKKMEEKRWISLPQLSVLNEAGEEVELEDQLLAGKLFNCLANRGC